MVLEKGKKMKKAVVVDNVVINVIEVEAELFDERQFSPSILVDIENGRPWKGWCLREGEWCPPETSSDLSLGNVPEEGANCVSCSVSSHLLEE